MSRHVRFSADRRYEVAYGRDHACGTFLQVFDNSDPKVETMIEDHDQASWSTVKGDPATYPSIAAKYGVNLTLQELQDA